MGGSCDLRGPHTRGPPQRERCFSSFRGASTRLSYAPPLVCPLCRPQELEQLQQLLLMALQQRVQGFILSRGTTGEVAIGEGTHKGYSKGASKGGPQLSPLRCDLLWGRRGRALALFGRSQQQHQQGSRGGSSDFCSCWCCCSSKKGIVAFCPNYFLSLD